MLADPVGRVGEAFFEGADLVVEFALGSRAVVVVVLARHADRCAVEVDFMGQQFADDVACNARDPSLSWSGTHDWLAGSHRLGHRLPKFEVPHVVAGQNVLPAGRDFIGEQLFRGADGGGGHVSGIAGAVAS